MESDSLESILAFVTLVSTTKLRFVYFSLFFYTSYAFIFCLLIIQSEQESIRPKGAFNDFQLAKLDLYLVQSIIHQRNIFLNVEGRC